MPQVLIHKVSPCLDVNRHGQLVICHDTGLSLSAFPYLVPPSFSTISSGSTNVHPTEAQAQDQLVGPGNQAIVLGSEAALSQVTT